MEADDLLCSRNARSQTPLVGRAQWETNSGHPPGEDASELEGTIGSGARGHEEMQRCIRVVLGIEDEI